MRAAVVGTGRMGQQVERVLRSRGHTVTAFIGRAINARGEALTPSALGAPEVVIEFTVADAAPLIVPRLLDEGMPVVSGTTGWQADDGELRRRIEAHGGALLRAANFALGIHAMAAAARELARLFQRYDGYDARMHEVHHALKRDAPSGTALFLQRTLRQEGLEVPITSERIGEVPGTHTLTFSCGAESLSLEHRVNDRAVFAEGAVRAAEWLVGRRGLFSIEDMLSER